jgi:hypothetical protein
MFAWREDGCVSWAPFDRDHATPREARARSEQPTDLSVQILVMASTIRSRPDRVHRVHRRETKERMGMTDPAYVSKVRIERLGGPQRLAYLPAEEEPVAFGVHSEVAEHYGVGASDYPPHATTLDYVVAAAGG